MRWLAALTVVAAAALALGAAHGRADAPAGCGLPSKGPLWIDYAGHNAPIVPKPGLILALSSGTVLPAQFRAAGAATIFFDLHLNDRVGTPSAPADPATIAAKAQKEFDFAVAVTGCRAPLIAENELFGAQTPTPWTDTTAQYRANVLALLAALNALGATTAITIANPPYLDGDAADWWRDAARESILVRQVFFTSPRPKGLYALGPERASRSMRQGMRGLVAHFGRIGIPASRVALELQFQSAPGEGGRQGLEPTAAWLEFVKLEALAAKQVARELPRAGDLVVGLAVLLGRGQRSRQAGCCLRLPLGARPTSLRRACARGAAVRLVAHGGRSSALPAGVRCTLGTSADPEERGRSHRRADRRPPVGGNGAAPTGRPPERAAGRPADGARRRAGDRARPLRPKPARYRAALAAARLTVADARAIIADRLARDRVEERFRPQPATSSQVTAFLATYAATRVRLVSVAPEAPWLGDASRGFAVETIAPDEVFTLPQTRSSSIDTADGRFAVRPLGPPLPLLGLPPADAQEVARRVLGRFARDDVYERWLNREEGELLTTAVCARDALPAKGDVDLTAWAPFLGD